MSVPAFLSELHEQMISPGLKLGSYSRLFLRHFKRFRLRVFGLLRSLSSLRTLRGVWIAIVPRLRVGTQWLTLQRPEVHRRSGGGFIPTRERGNDEMFGMG